MTIINSHGYYTDPETIRYAQDVYFTMGNDALRNLVAKVFMKIPADIVGQIIDDCFYLMPMPEDKGSFFPNRIIKNHHIILFPYSLLDEPEEEQIHTILHETAHYVLKHQSPLEDSFPSKSDAHLEKYDKQEDEANDLVKKWLTEKNGGDRMKNEDKHGYSFNATITINGKVEAGTRNKARERVRKSFEGHHTIKELDFTVSHIHKLEIQGP